MTQADPTVTILIVDDNQINVELLEELLTLQGYQTVATTNGDSAQAIARESQPDLILLDVNMPGLTGIDVCRNLKRDASTADIPVIFISALSEAGSILDAFEAGGVDYITKPFRTQEVLARVSTQVTLHRQKHQIETLRERDRQHYMTLDEMRQQFIGSATHDLKSPLFIVSGYADLLSSLPRIQADLQALGFVEAIQRGVTKMNALIHDMLDLLQLETDATLERTEFDLTEFLKRTVQEHAVSASEKRLTLTIGNPDEPVEVSLDAGRMARVLDNLVSNAIKYTEPQGSITVTGQLDDGNIVIVVADDGIGIPVEHQARLFDPFRRVDTEEHMEREGSGLGLSIVKTIVEQHGGEVAVDSASNQGTTVTITIPVAARAPVDTA